MIIHNRDRYVFVAVPKTATTTIHNYFRQSIVVNDRDEWLQKKYHYPLSSILKENKYASKFFKFGFSRNPWDRMVSSWIDFSTSEGHLKVWSQDLPKDFSSFEDFILNFPNTHWSEELHFLPSYAYLEGADFVGKYENLNEDFKKVLSNINHVEIDILNLPKERKTDRKGYRSYYTNQKMIDAVADFFHDDIEQYGYEF